MREQPAAEIRRRGAALGIFAAPVLMLAGDALRYWAGAQRTWFVMLKLALALFVGATLGVVALTRGRADGAGLLGGALAVVGCLAGACIVTANDIFQSFNAAGLDEATTRAAQTAMMSGDMRAHLFLYPLPGLAFPVGFLVLAYALVRARAASTTAALLVALGAILFPVGRIGGIEAAIMGSGLAFTLGMTPVALRLLGLSTGEWLRPTGTEALREQV